MADGDDGSYNDRMIPKLSAEQAAALGDGCGPLEVVDAAGSRHFVIISKDEYRTLVERGFRQWLQVGLDQEAAGEVEPWSVEEVLVEARRSRGEPTSS